MFHHQPEHCWKWNSAEMGRGTGIQLCLQRHNHLHLSGPHPALCALQTPFLSFHGAWNYKLPPQNLRAAAQGPRTPAQVGLCPSEVWCSCCFSSREEAVVNLSQNNYFLVSELNILSNICLLKIMFRSSFLWGWRLVNFHRSIYEGSRKNVGIL